MHSSLEVFCPLRSRVKVSVLGHIEHCLNRCLNIDSRSPLILFCLSERSTFP